MDEHWVRVGWASFEVRTFPPSLVLFFNVPIMTMAFMGLHSSLFLAFCNDSVNFRIAPVNLCIPFVAAAVGKDRQRRVHEEVVLYTET